MSFVANTLGDLHSVLAVSTSCSSVLAISSFWNFHALGPARYGAERIGYIPSGDSMLICLGALIWPRWPSHVDLNRGNTSKIRGDTVQNHLVLLSRIATQFLSRYGVFNVLLQFYLYLTMMWTFVMCSVDSHLFIYKSGRLTLQVALRAFRLFGSSIFVTLFCGAFVVIIKLLVQEPFFSSCLGLGSSSRGFTT